MAPFRDEQKVIQEGGLTIENRLDRVSIYGSLDITKDKVGLVRAQRLKELIDGILDRLQHEPLLPDEIELEKTVIVKNPLA